MGGGDSAVSEEAEEEEPTLEAVTTAQGWSAKAQAANAESGAEGFAKRRSGQHWQRPVRVTSRGSDRERWIVSAIAEHLAEKGKDRGVTRGAGAGLKGPSSQGWARLKLLRWRRGARVPRREKASWRRAWRRRRRRGVAGGLTARTGEARKSGVLPGLPPAPLS